MKMRDLTVKPPVTVTAETTLAAAAQLMDRQAVGAVVVVDGERPVGIATDRDIVVRGVARRVLGPSSSGVGSVGGTRVGDVGAEKIAR
jgi:CBS domain-containing protein